MRPQLLKFNLFPTNSFSVRHDCVPYINNKWHFHKEVELIYFKNGSGTQYIGDNIKEFHSGDVLLVGSQLPHYWSFDVSYFNDEKNNPDVSVIHFKENFWGNQFLDLPENKPLKDLLEIAKYGLSIEGSTRTIVANMMCNMRSGLAGNEKLLLLLEILLVIANSKSYKVLSSLGFKSECLPNEDDRINTVYNYSLNNYKRKISTEEIAKIANMSPNSFCRFFKSKTQKTYSNFLIELRVGVACKLLVENRISIKQICYECGFNNAVSFHKYFKLITKKTPAQYQYSFLKNKFF